MERLSLALRPDLRSTLPVTAIQFGEGNFLRGFLDWMLYRLNRAGMFQGRVLAVQPTPRGRVVPVLAAQDHLYTVWLHGVRDGWPVEEHEVVNVIGATVNPYDDAQWAELLRVGARAEIRYVFSNTTEAGIVYVACPRPAGRAPATYPAQLTALLQARFAARGADGKPPAGLLIMPCELIEHNGGKLREAVLRHADDWQAGAAFREYVEHECAFPDTLVDRVVSGYPKEDADAYLQKLGYRDDLLTCGEMFHQLAVSGDEALAARLPPFARAGLNAVVTPDIAPYWLRKVRILNGAHTAAVPAAYLMGQDTVHDLMTAPLTGTFIHDVVFDEIIPAVPADQAMLRQFATEVLQRFGDPAQHHRLEGILMNGASKVRARLVPTLTAARARGIMPRRLCFSLAAFLALYKSGDGTTPVRVVREDGRQGAFRDEPRAAEILHRAWDYYHKNEASAVMTVKAALSAAELWGRDLSADVDLTACVAKLTHAVITDGVAATLAAVTAM